MFGRFRWGLTSGERYSTGRLPPEARNLLRLPAFCVRACRSLGGVRRTRSQNTTRIALTHSTPLPFPTQFACALFVRGIAGDGAKSVPDRQRQAKVATKKTCKRPGALLACEGAGRSCMDGASRGLAFGAGNLRKTRLRSIGPPLFPRNKRRRACSCSDRNNVSSKEHSTGTQALACQAFWALYDHCHTWIRTVSAARSVAKKRFVSSLAPWSAVEAGGHNK